MLCHSCVSLGEAKYNTLRAPALHNTAEEHLFGIVGYIWTKAKDDAMKVTIRALHHQVRCHVPLQRLKDVPKRCMEELVTELVKLSIV